MAYETGLTYSDQHNILQKEICIVRLDILAFVAGDRTSWPGQNDNILSLKDTVLHLTQLNWKRTIFYNLLPSPQAG
jgi:hypothetical protein